MRTLLIGAIAVLAGAPGHGQRHSGSQVRVPFVGCRTGGQPGAQPPPGAQQTPLLPPELARRLAYYQARGGPGVLAPRGWHCRGLGGSSGVSLSVQPKMGARLYRVEVGYVFGGTSGRMGVAEDIARYFPSYRPLIPGLIRDLQMGPMPTGPYPHDEISRRTDTLVRFTTPPRTDGEGSLAFGRWGPSAKPVQGILRLVEAPGGPDIFEVNVQLPDVDKDLANVILKQAAASPRPDLGWPPLQ